jgi:hypothetical protein
MPELVPEVVGYASIPMVGIATETCVHRVGHLPNPTDNVATKTKTLPAQSRTCINSKSSGHRDRAKNTFRDVTPRPSLLDRLRKLRRFFARRRNLQTDLLFGKILLATMAKKAGNERVLLRELRGVHL